MNLQSTKIETVLFTRFDQFHKGAEHVRSKVILPSENFMLLVTSLIPFEVQVSNSPEFTNK